MFREVFWIVKMVSNWLDERGLVGSCKFMFNEVFGVIKCRDLLFGEFEVIEVGRFFIKVLLFGSFGD